ncbi:MAG: phosphogluconate dehydrogenase (NAD(+)-dependent, decarboxylating) [Thermodesulfobacteriota bacterium]
MRMGMAGLGRMGMDMALRLVRGGVEVVGYNRSPRKVDDLAGEGGAPAYTLAELVEKLAPPRVVWLMLPAGAVVEEHLEALAGLLDPGDLVADGGNSHYRDSVRRAADLARAGLLYADVGVSGGVWGRELGYCLMVGGPVEAYERLRPALDVLAASGGIMYCGGHGAGHFVKMVHNGIEYGLMQAYAEGFHILEASPYGPGLDFAAVARMWSQGGVIRSWLLELAEAAFARDPGLAGLAAWVEDSGEGRWTVEQAVDSAVYAPVITLSLMERFRSRERNSFADRLLAALRREFGGHAVRPPGGGE